MDEIRSKYKVLLVNLRDPVDRFMSAFYWTMGLTCDPSGDKRKPDQKKPTGRPDLYCRPNPNMMAFYDKYNRDANELASALCSSDHERAKQASEDMRHIPRSKHDLVDWLGLILSDLKLSDTLFPIVLEPSFDFESQIDDAIRWSYNISSSDTSDTPAISEKDLGVLHRKKHTSNSGAHKELSERNQACIAQHYSSDYKLLQQIKDEACRTATCKEAIQSIQRRRSPFLKQDASIEEQPGRRLVVSIGPPKTATSTLQEFFKTYASDQNAETKAAAFEKWNYPMFFGETNGLRHLTHQNSAANNDIEKLLREQSSTKNIFLVSEHLSVRFYDKPKIEHLERWTNTKAEIVVTHRTPRVSHLISNWKQITQSVAMRKEFGKYENSFRDFMCDSSHNRSLSFLELQTNTLKLASKAIERNWTTYLIDSGGLGGQDVAHAFGCDVLRLNCPDGMWLEGLEDVNVHKNSKSGDPNLTEMERINLENIFAQRDCAFREELENNPLLTILHRQKLWENCTIVEPKYRHDPYFMLTKMRDVLSCPTASSDGEKIVIQDSYVLALMERLFPSRIDFLRKLAMVVVLCLACFRRKLAQKWMVLAK